MPYSLEKSNTRNNSTFAKQPGRNWSSLLCWVLISGLFFSCSTRKNNLATRSFHNLTSYYNVLWNAEQAFSKVERTLKEKASENYFQVLPVCLYGTPEDTNLTKGDLQTVIEKTALSIKKHSIIDKGKEQVKHIDDAYLLMGKAFFYRHEYSKARMVLNFVVSEFASAKERYEAMIWVARTYMMEGEYDMALGLLKKVEDEKNSLSKSVARELPLAFAEYYCRQEEYDKAVPYIEEGLSYAKNKDQKARLEFILGQIAQNRNELETAYHHYKDCLKMNPPLSMVFNARLNLALCLCNPSEKEYAGIESSLKRMLNDPKNTSYFGRIFYVLGEMAFSQGREEVGVEYMDKSIVSSEGDPQRMLLAAKKLSGYFFDKQDYIRAQKYYAIAAKVVEPDEEDYYTIMSRDKNLAELVTYYKDLTKADTLKMLGKMNPGERRRYAQKKVSAYKAEQERNRIARQGSSYLAPGMSPSNWYFYNSQMRNMGKQEFNQKWGKRSLEDLWFLSSKPPLAMLKSMQKEKNESNMADLEIEKPLTPEDPDYYLQSLPESPDDYFVLDSTIEYCLFKIGLIYFDLLGEARQGEYYFLRLEKEYPSSLYMALTYENLCKIYHGLGDGAKFARYAGLLAEKFPGSESDNRINDSDYLSNLAQSEKEILHLYKEVYQLYERRLYAQMLDRIDAIDEQYSTHRYKPQLQYLKAIAVAYERGFAESLSILEDFLVSYGTHELKPQVEALIAYIKDNIEKGVHGVGKGGLKSSPTTPLITKVDEEADTADIPVPAVEYAKFRQASIHYFAIVINAREVNANLIKIKLGDFNRKSNSNRLDITQEKVDDSWVVLKISQFRNAKAAMDYHRNLLLDEYVFLNIDKKHYRMFPISMENYPLMVRSKDFDSYQEYFRQHYKEEE